MLILIIYVPSKCYYLKIILSKGSCSSTLRSLAKLPVFISLLFCQRTVTSFDSKQSESHTHTHTHTHTQTHTWTSANMKYVHPQKVSNSFLVVTTCNRRNGSRFDAQLLIQISSHLTLLNNVHVLLYIAVIKLGSLL